MEAMRSVRQVAPTYSNYVDVDHKLIACVPSFSTSPYLTIQYRGDGLRETVTSASALIAFVPRNRSWAAGRIITVTYSEKLNRRRLVRHYSWWHHSEQKERLTIHASYAVLQSRKVTFAASVTAKRWTEIYSRTGIQHQIWHIPVIRESHMSEGSCMTVLAGLFSNVGMRDLLFGVKI